MIPLNVVFWGLVALFGIIGALRGWAKEIMVVCSVLLALFIQQVFGHFVLRPGNDYLPLLLTVSEVASAPDLYTETQFFTCTGLLLVLTFFGYSGPTLVKRLGAKVARERLQDALLGFFLGLVNGYLIIGTLWFYLAKAGYVSVIEGMQPPVEGTAAWAIAHSFLLPLWLTAPILYVAIALAFVFVIIMFI